jgi:hypothetical protein
MKPQERNKRIFNLISGRIKYLFKETLTAVEKESKDFDVNTKFFEKPQKGSRAKGFYSVRKKLFDHGNNIIELLRLILDQVQITPTKTIVQLDKKLLDEEKDGKDD